MKPRNITMHGPPGAGKTSLKRVIIGLSPLPSEEQNATDIVENAVRAVSTNRITADGERSVMLTEVDNEELIKMLARKVESHRITGHQTQHKPVSTVCDRKKLENFGWQGTCPSYREQSRHPLCNLKIFKN